MSKSFLYELSYLRGIAIFAVVIVHAIVIARWQLNWEAEMQITHMTLFFLAGLFRFALPVFIFISGFTFFDKIPFGN